MQHSQLVRACIEIRKLKEQQHQKSKKSSHYASIIQPSAPDLTEISYKGTSGGRNPTTKAKELEELMQAIEQSKQEALDHHAKAEALKEQDERALEEALRLSREEEERRKTKANQLERVDLETAIPLSVQFASSDISGSHSGNKVPSPSDMKQSELTSTSNSSHTQTQSPSSVHDKRYNSEPQSSQFPTPTRKSPLPPLTGSRISSQIAKVEVGVSDDFSGEGEYDEPEGYYHTPHHTKKSARC